MIGAVANIVLDPIFIFGLHLDVRGAALATVLSQMCSCFYVLRFLFGKKVPIRITFHGYDPRLMLQVARVGFSPFVIIALDNVLIISQNMVIQRLGGPGQGDTILTCAAIVQSFMLIITMPLGGITSGTQTILGYNYGARRRYPQRGICSLKCLGYPDVHAGRDPAGSTVHDSGRIYRNGHCEGGHYPVAVP